MRPLPGLTCVLALLGLSGCGANTPTASSPTALPTPVDRPPLAVGPAQHVGALGIYWLTPDPTDPLAAILAPARSGAAHGDVYDLSIRPFMNAEHLELVGVAIGPDETTEYTLRFTHPVPMPSDLARPATQTKRVDLFLFDVNVVMAVPGSKIYFGGQVKTNIDAMTNADGYRMIDPMVELPSLGITDGTNTFPYRVLNNTDPTNPAGNYDPVMGWYGNELLAPSGYDVIPQGGSATTVARVKNGLAGPLAVVVLAKYQDPRIGPTSTARQENRLPDPANPSLLRYFLPEACGDLQDIGVYVEGSLDDQHSGDIATVIARVLDWDQTAAVSPLFPNHFDLSQISKPSQPKDIAASVPDLWANGSFLANSSAISGTLSEYSTYTIPVNNVDQSFQLADPGPVTVYGLVRVRDTQDTIASEAWMLDEQQRRRAFPPGFELSTRYQRFEIPFASGALVPIVEQVVPTWGTPGEWLTLEPRLAQGNPVSWHWEFGGAATIAESNEQSPTIKLRAPGEYTVTLTVGAASGERTFGFTLTSTMHTPALPATPFDYTPELPDHFTNPQYAFGESVAQADNTPGNNPVTDAGATLGRVLFYDTLMSRNRAVACASCHKQSKGFADNVSLSIGFDGGRTKRHSPSLANARYYDTGRFFLDERAATLEEAVLMPIQDPIEMGMTLPELRERLEGISYYPELFRKAFGSTDITDDRIAFALAQFVRSLVSFNSKTDTAQALAPNIHDGLTAEEFLGFRIFNGEFSGSGWGSGSPRMTCAKCHRTATQTLGAGGGGSGPVPGPFAVNTGLDLDTSTDEGAGEGRFKSPTLRNVAVSAPYMHDGRFATLDEVVDFYASGVQPHPDLHPNLRQGRNPTAPPQQFNLSTSDRAALIAYLRTFTDDDFLNDPKFSDPFAD